MAQIVAFPSASEQPAAMCCAVLCGAVLCCAALWRLSACVSLRCALSDLSIATRRRWFDIAYNAVVFDFMLSLSVCVSVCVLRLSDDDDLRSAILPA